MNDGVVSMGARVEVTKRLRRAYRGASKKEKGRVLDGFCESTGLSRATVRRYLTSDVTGNPGVVRIDYRKVGPQSIPRWRREYYNGFGCYQDANAVNIWQYRCVFGLIPLKRMRNW